MIWWLLGVFGTLGVVAVGAGWWLAGRPEAGVHAAPRGSDNEDLPRLGRPALADGSLNGQETAGPGQPRRPWICPDCQVSWYEGHVCQPERWALGGAPVPGRVRLVLDGAAQLVAVAGLVLQDA